MRRLVVFMAAFMVATSALMAQSSDDVNIKAVNAVTPFDIKEWAERLTSEEFRGRAAGDIGFDLAANWVAAHYRDLGLEPFGDDGTYFDNFNQPFTQVLDKGSLSAHFVVAGDTITKNYEYLKDYFPTALSASGTISAEEVVYINCGISAPELGFDAYKGLDVKGKVVLCESGMPYKGNNLDTMKMWSKYLESRMKVHTAAQKGAKAILFIYPISSCAPSPGDDILAAYISPEAANDMLSGSGTTHAELNAAIKAGDFRTASARHSVTMTAHTKHHEDAKTANVVSIIEGTDPVLKDEYIILGAHLDHLGMLPELFMGALDNASGVTITMGIAKAIKESGVDLKRSVIFINYGAEEVGLVGSEHFMAELPFPKESVKLVINYDMVGVGKGFALHGTYHAKQQTELFGDVISKWVHRPLTTNVADKWEFSTYPRTDGGVFENEKMPVLYFTLIDGWKDIYYHHPLDDLRQLNYTMMSDVVAASAVSIIAAANE